MVLNPNPHSFIERSESETGGMDYTHRHKKIISSLPSLPHHDFLVDYRNLNLPAWFNMCSFL